MIFSLKTLLLVVGVYEERSCVSMEQRDRLPEVFNKKGKPISGSFFKVQTNSNGVLLEVVVDAK